MKPNPIRYVVSSLPMQAGNVPAGGGPVAPTAEFIGAPTSGTAPVAVVFTNQSTGVFSAQLWDFGDGSTSTSANPTHNYTAAGTYTVTLTLTWAGGTVTRTRTAYIVASVPVTPALTFALADTGTAGVAASGSITNTSAVASGPWSIAAIANSTMTPSSGSSIAPGATVSLSFTATQAATYTPILVCAGATITGASQPIVVSAPPAIAISATGGGSPTVGVPFNLSALLTNATTLPDVGTWQNLSGSGSATPPTVTFALGDLNKTSALVWASAGSVSVRMTTASGVVSNTLALTVSAAPPPVPTGDVPQFLTGDGGTVTVDSQNVQAPTRDLWSRRLGIAWKRLPSSGPLYGLGNWLDATLANEGSSAYASTGAVSTVGQTLTATVTTLVQRWRSNGLNRGFYLSARASAWPVDIYGRGDASSANRPKLNITTTTGSFTLTAAANASWNTTSFTTFPGSGQFRLASGQQPAIVRFDLSTVTGTVTAATLTMVVKALPGSAGQIVDVFEADPPTLLDPVTVASPTVGLLDGYANFNAFKASGHASLLAADDFELGGPFDTGFDPAATRVLDSATGTTYARGTIAADPGGTTGTGSLSNKQNISVGGVRGVPSVVRPHLFSHYRFKMEADFGTTQPDAIKIPAMGVQFGWWNPSGYWQQTTGNGGAVGTGLKVDNGTGIGGPTQGNFEYQGHSIRILTGTDPLPGDDDPYRGYFGLQLYPYNLDQGGPNPASRAFPNTVWRRGSWYDFDLEVQQNSMTGSQDGLGNYATANADGVARVWMNGALVYEETTLRWRRHPEMGVEFLWLDVYHGGQTPALVDMHYQVDQVAVATAYIGPKAAVVPAIGVEPVPVFQAAKSYDNASAFTTTLTSADAGEQFNVGTGPSTGIIVRVVASTHAATIDSFVIGGVTLTALAQTALSGWSANERVFYGVGLSLAGPQDWTATVSGAARINVQLFAARSAVTFTVGPVVAALTNTLSQATIKDRHTLTVGMLTSNHDSGTLAVKNGTYQRWTRNGNFYKDLIVTEPESDESIDAAIIGGAFTFSWLGRVCYLQGAVRTFPSYVPPAGEIAQLTVANGKLANSFTSQCAPYYAPFYFNKTNATYGGCAGKNRYWGSYGCAIYWGGGDANTNDNTVTIAEYGASQITFKRVVDPTPWTGSTATDSTNQQYNSNGNTISDFSPRTLDWNAGLTNIVYGETINMPPGLTRFNGFPGAPHNYGNPCVVGPEFGGGAHGSLISTFKAAVCRTYNPGAASAHIVDFDDAAAASSTRNWRKLTSERYEGSSWGAASVVSDIVGRQKRVYTFLRGNTTIRWFDLVLNQYVTGAGVGFDTSTGSFDGGQLFEVPQRGLLVFACQRSGDGSVMVQWMDVTVDQPTLGGTAILSKILTSNQPSSAWGAACWCKDNSRIIVAGVGEAGAPDYTCAYEIEIPAVLTGSPTWVCTKAPLPGGQTFPTYINGANVYKRFHYDDWLKSIFYYVNPDSSAPDVAWIYRPRGT